MKKLAVAGVLTGLVLALSACDDPTDPKNPNNWREADIKLQDGRTVHCLMWGDARGGPSCDWANAK